MKHVVVIGGGVGGTVTANRLRKKLSKKEVKITLIDEDGIHYYLPSTLFAFIGMDHIDNNVKPEKELLHKGIDLITDRVSYVDADNRKIKLSSGKEIEYDYLVIAAGATINEEEIPGFKEAAHHFHSYQGAMKLYEAIKNFKGGKIVIGIGGLPYRCPPSPYEATLMIHDYFKNKKKIKNFEIEFLSPLNRLFTIETVSKEVFEPKFEEKGIEWHPFTNVDYIDPEKKVVHTLEGEEFKYDLLILTPPHMGSQIEYNDGLADNEKWVQTHKHKLTVKDYDDVYAVGDITNIPTSKAGSVAEFEGEVASKRIFQDIVYGSPDETYDGKTVCFVITDIGKATIVKFDYQNPPRDFKITRLNWLLKKMYRSYYYKVMLKNPFSLNNLFTRIFL